MALTAAPARRPPAHLRPGNIALVALGGAVGTTARSWAGAAGAAGAAASGTFPVVTLAINVSGAFLLGALLEALVALGPEGPRRRALRLALGTGLLGGYTTYSTFVLETVALGSDGRLLLALAYDAASLVGGFLAALGAMAGTRALLARRPRS